MPDPTLDPTAPVRAQLEAYNRRDLEAFLACYAPDCRMEDGAGAVLAADRDAMRPQYAGCSPAARTYTPRCPPAS